MNMDIPKFSNPFRPGAGHRPPFLAGRREETDEFRKLLSQSVILENLVLTGLRGVGKTVLLEAFKPIAINEGWVWVGADLSESTSVSEETVALRLLSDLAVFTSTIPTKVIRKQQTGFGGKTVERVERLDFGALSTIYGNTPGLVSDKIKAVLEAVWHSMPEDSRRGIVFAYDEAQNLSDHSEKDQYPLSLILDVFQSIQRKGIPFMLALVGLPTLFPKLVEARTYTERMFHVVFLDRLSRKDSTEAITKPIDDANCPVTFKVKTVRRIYEWSGGYPYFIQFICREVFDAWIQSMDTGGQPTAPFNEIIRRLDTDFFAGRWAKATDRQKDLLSVIAGLPNCDKEFTVQDIVTRSKTVLQKPFGGSHVNQMLGALGEAGLIYKNRHGRYSFAVPLLGRFIQRQEI